MLLMAGAFGAAPAGAFAAEGKIGSGDGAGVRFAIARR